MVAAQQTTSTTRQRLVEELQHSPLIFLRGDQVVRAMFAARNDPQLLGLSGSGELEVAMTIMKLVFSIYQ